MITRADSRIFTSSPYTGFLKFLTKIAIIDLTDFRKIPKIICRVNSKNPGIVTSYHFCDFLFKNDILGLKIQSLKFLGIQPRIHIIKIGDTFTTKTSTRQRASYNKDDDIFMRENRSFWQNRANHRFLLGDNLVLFKFKLNQLDFKMTL